MSQDYLFTSPMARKKKNECHVDPNTYRVISEHAMGIPSVRHRESSVPVYLPSINLIGQPTLPRPETEHRHHRPNPQNVNFLRHDVRLFNQPVCNVNTDSTASEQHQWWPHQTPSGERRTPAHPNDTIVRQDYQYRGSGIKPSGRFGSKTRSTVARGIVPVNIMEEADNKQRFWQEGISYEHQYNSRIDQHYPMRARRHGAFVWDQVPPTQVDKLLEREHLHEQQTPTYPDFVKRDSKAKEEPSKQQKQHKADNAFSEPQQCSMPAIEV